MTKVGNNNYLCSKDYFDGLGRVIQTQSCGESAAATIISSTTTYNTRGLVDKQYVSQSVASSSVNGYFTPGANWKYSSNVYDGLGRVISQTAADGTVTSDNFSVAWQDLKTDARGYNTLYTYDAFNRLKSVFEYKSDNTTVSGNTTYSYDVLGNLLNVTDANGNVTTLNYDWLSHKTSMSDPDMGNWSYFYDNNGNLSSQNDASQNTTYMSYDSLNRLTGKSYSASANMTNVSYGYDNGANDKGQRTSMIDASGNTTYTYDARARLITETRNINTGSNNFTYTTAYAYDSADRITSILYPTGENVTQSYSARGLPNSLSGNVSGTLVTGMNYNSLGEPTEIDLGNGLKTTYSYWGIDYGTTSYGRLYEIKTLPLGGGTPIQDVTQAWDADGDLSSRYDSLTQDTENFSYDFLDRLTGVSGSYTQSCNYTAIGNIMSMNGINYGYGSQPHAVTSVGSMSYSYDANGNMVTRGSQSLAWDANNRPISITTNGTTAYYVYDGDGNRVMQTENSQTTLFVNQYYNINLATSTNTSYYYLGSQLIAQSVNSTLQYIHQDELGGTSVMSNSSGTLLGTIKYLPFGDCLQSPDLPTDKLFTGQILDNTGLYYYNARYYDPTIGRFISPDIVTPDLNNPQSLNRYSYALNNPLKYNDPTGNWPNWGKIGQFFEGVGIGIGTTLLSTAEMVVNPAQTITAIGEAITNPSDTWNAIKTSYEDKSSSSEGVGEIVGQALTLVATCALTAGVGASSGAADVGSDVASDVGELAETTGENSGMTSLFRAVNEPEAADINNSEGAFNPSPQGSESKYFSTTLEGASKEAKILYNLENGIYGLYTIYQTQFPTSLLTPEMIVEGGADFGVPTVAIPNELLPNLTPAQALYISSHW